MGEEFLDEIGKAKKTFNIKRDNKILQLRIGQVMRDQLDRNRSYDTQLILNRCYGLFYQIDNLKDLHTPFRLYKIFKLCLEGLDELLFFNDTIGETKDYSGHKVREIIEKAKPFIKNSDQIEVRIPIHPNSEYNEIYFTLLNDYKIKKEDVLLILESIYDKKKKAQPPKRRINELKELRSIFHRIIKGGGKEKGLTHEQIETEIRETDIHFKDYL